MSTKSQDAVPASLRRPVERSNFGQGLLARAVKPLLVGGTEARAKSYYAALPQEPEDARMTGVTRSLTRRLLALNVSGTLMRTRVVAGSRIA